MTKSTTTPNSSHYPEIQDIRNDLDSLKTNVFELTRHVQEEGIDQTQQLAKKARKSLDAFQVLGKRELQDMERRIKAEPAKSLAIAFAVGMFASTFLGRKG